MTERQSPNYSIVIPTRNGIRYLPFAIDSVLSQDCQSCELIVSDNHSSDGTAEFLQTIKDPRLRVIKPPRLLSMVDHFEYALAAACGDWVTMLGDDDGLMPFFFEQLRVMPLAEVRADAIVFRRAYYVWAGCEDLYGEDVTWTFPYTRRCYQNNFRSLFLCLGSIIEYFHLPQTYTTGLVRRRYLEEIKSKSGGVFFHGEAPDAASAVALLLNARRHYRVELPIFWTGTSPKSTGYSQESEKDKTRAEEFDRLNATGSSPKTNKLPNDLLSHFDLAIIFYEALLRNPSCGWIWRSLLMRHVFFAGLAMKDEKYVEILRKCYGDKLHSWLLYPLIVLLKRLRKRHEARETTLNFADASLRFHSTDRSLFPTMKEASAASLDLWRHLRATGQLK